MFNPSIILEFIGGTVGKVLDPRIVGVVYITFETIGV